MSLIDRINKKLKSFIKGEKKEKKPEDEQCPVCGYYCTGNGGVGCIDKPNTIEKEIQDIIDNAEEPEPVIYIAKETPTKPVKLVYGSSGNSPKVQEAIKEVVDDMMALSDEEFQKEIDEAKEELACKPDTCFGECQGQGECEIAIEWQERIHPPIRKAAVRRQVIKAKRKKKKHRGHDPRPAALRFDRNLRKKKKKHKRKLKRKR